MGSFVFCDSLKVCLRVCCAYRKLENSPLKTHTTRESVDSFRNTYMCFVAKGWQEL